jgi:hypothetical protein
VTVSPVSASCRRDIAASGLGFLRFAQDRLFGVFAPQDDTEEPARR